MITLLPTFWTFEDFPYFWDGFYTFGWIHTRHLSDFLAFFNNHLPRSNTKFYRILEIKFLIEFCFFVLFDSNIAHRSRLVGNNARSQIEWHPGRWNGPRKGNICINNQSFFEFVLILYLSVSFCVDHSNDLVACSFGVCQGELGAAFDCGSVIGDAQLGNGIQKMVSRFQDLNLLWLTERTKTKAHRLDEGERISCVHHIIQTGHTRSSEFSTKKVEILDIGWSAKH